MNYLSLRYFLEIANCLNFSLAAQRLHISQPGLSQQITALEKELGIKLLYRSTRKVILTEEGEYLYKNLLASFENIEKIVSELKAAGTIPQTTLKIATVPSAASTLVPVLIQKLKEKFPNIEFFIKETTSVNAVELMRRSEYHLAFIRTPIDIKQTIPTPLTWMEFAKHPLQLVVSGHHETVMKKKVDLYDFRNENFLHYDPKHSPSLYYLLELACLTAGFIPKTIGTGPEILTMANLIAKGIGITLMPSDMLQLLHPFKIKGIGLNNLSLYSSISVIWNEIHVPSMVEHAIHILEQIRQSSPEVL